MPRAARAVCGFYHSTGKAEVPTPAGYFYRFPHAVQMRRLHQKSGRFDFYEQSCCIFAEGTEECEALLVVDLLRRAKVDVTVASASGSREIVSSHKVHITADALAEEVDYSDVDMVVLPGGIPGTPNLAANKTVTDTCVSFAKSGKR